MCVLIYKHAYDATWKISCERKTTQKRRETKTEREKSVRIHNLLILTGFMIIQSLDNVESMRKTRRGRILVKFVDSNPQNYLDT